MADGSWEDGDFEVPVIADDPEEAFSHPKPVTEEEEGLDDGLDRPVLLLDIAALAAQLGDVGSDSYPTVRAHVLSTLEADFSRRSSELLASGLCWHSMRSCATQEREEREASRPGSFLTVFEYPDELEGAPVEALWDAVIQPTEWECLDEVRRCPAPAPNAGTPEPTPQPPRLSCMSRASYPTRVELADQGAPRVV